MLDINIIGAGLAGCEAALSASRLGVKVNLFDIKPQSKTPAHSSDGLAELVCSNSLKSDNIVSAAGLLKSELAVLGSAVMEAASISRVPAGGALAVDREVFSRHITNLILNDPNITFLTQEVEEIPDGIAVIATGPLTTPALADSIANITGENQLYFYDAAAPIIDADSIDYDSAYFMDRYQKDSGTGDYLNCPLSRYEYEIFYNELIAAKRAPLREFEDLKVFEGCMPIEVMARRGADTLRFGPLKPVGLRRSLEAERPYAVVQLRKENLSGSCFNMVGFQTNLTFSEQKRVFSLIPALKNAEFIRYGVMHRNTYVNSPRLLSKCFELSSRQGVFFAGQISGVEGYVESAASGLMCGINAARRAKGLQCAVPGQQTVMGALAAYISQPSENFQPMGANYAIISPAQQRFSDKKQRNMYYAQRSAQEIEIYRQFIGI